MNSYREVKISELELGDKFLFSGTLFEKVYDKHAIVVGLTTIQFKFGEKNGRQARSFADDDIVLVKIEQL